MPNARKTVYRALLNMERERAYSNLLLDQTLAQSDLSAQDKAFASQLFYGVIERLLTLDAIIQANTTVRWHKIDPEIKVILRMGLYQLLYLDGVAEFAAVDESVKLVRYAKKASARGFVNALLRSFVRDGKQVTLPDKQTDLVGHLSIGYSCPKWLVSNLIKEYGAVQAEQFLRHSLNRPPVSVRVNTLKTDTDMLIERLTEQGVQCTRHEEIDACIWLEKTGAIEGLAAYREGLFHVQDISSMLCCIALDAQPGQRVYDLCAAPGGKSFTIAQQMQNKGQLYAFDLYAHKVQLICSGAKRLGITNLQAAIGDASQPAQLELADRVLCDVPCSGLGVIRRKPEIKYKDPNELASLPQLQLQILKNAAAYVKPGGVLVYSTCSVAKDENDKVAAAFLEQMPDFSPVALTQQMRAWGISESAHTLTCMPQIKHTDGFFIAKFCRRT